MCWSIIAQYFVPRIPLLYVLLASLGFTLEKLIVKILTLEGTYPSFTCVLVRGFFQSIIGVFGIYSDHQTHLDATSSSIFTKIFGDHSFVATMLLLRCIFGFFSQSSALLAVEYLPIGDATVIGMMSPSISALGGYLLLGEPWRIPELLATLTSLIGMVFVVRPQFIFGSSAIIMNHNILIGIILAIINATCQAFVFLLLRILGTKAKISWCNVIFVQSLGQLILSFPASYLFGEKISIFNFTNIQYIFIIIAGFIGSCSQIALTIGMQREKSAAASGMRMGDIIFGFIFQEIFTNDKIKYLSLIGAILVSSSVIIILIFKETKDKDNTLMINNEQEQQLIHQFIDSKYIMVNTDEEILDLENEKDDNIHFNQFDAVSLELSPLQIQR